MLVAVCSATTPDSAIVVHDYPYGSHRTDIRYWMEYSKRKDGGYRFCHQTLNPKTKAWNKPKCGTYHPMCVMTLDTDTGFVSYRPVDRYNITAEQTLGLLALFDGRLESQDAQDHRAKLVDFIAFWCKVQISSAAKRLDYILETGNSPWTINGEHRPATDSERMGYYNDKKRCEGILLALNGAK